MQHDEQDTRALKKRIRELEMENRALKELVDVLQSIPAVMEEFSAWKKQDKERGGESGESASP